MARKTKYDPTRFPVLAEGYARKGLTDQEIAHNLGISKTTLYIYEDKYPEFRNSILKGKLPPNLVVEGSAYKRANGFEYDEVKEEYEWVTGANGRRRRHLVKRTVTRKYTPPDPASFIYWLNNRDPDNWKSLRHQEVHKEVDSVYDVVKRWADRVRQIDDAEIVEDDNGDS